MTNTHTKEDEMTHIEQVDLLKKEIDDYQKRYLDKSRQLDDLRSAHCALLDHVEVLQLENNRLRAKILEGSNNP